jgi:hypothetical protein
MRDAGAEPYIPETPEVSGFIGLSAPAAVPLDHEWIEIGSLRGE